MTRWLVMLLIAAGCSDGKSGPSPLVVARPYQSTIPSSYKGAPTPLVLLLHGYGVNGFVQDAYFGLDAAAETHGFLLAYPDGTVDADGKRFWNADDACCDFGGTGVDDVAYLNAVLDDMERQYNVDKKRVYVTGHSNGGFMANRLACDNSPRIAAIASLAGAVWKDPSKCNPTSPVAVLEIHGDVDDMVPYDGTAAIPSATETVATWAQKNGCAADLTDTGETKDLDFVVDGAETHVARHACSNGAAELWTMRGVGHIPNLRQPDWGDALWGTLSSHQR